MGGKPAGNAESRIMTAFVKSVSEAEKAMRALFPETPLQLNDYLSRKYGAEIWLKREDLTPVRSYKIRGAFNFISKAVETTDKNAVFVCASAGNHAQGFAFVCRHFGRKGVVFMPVTTPQQKIDKTRAFGGEFIEIKLVGDIFDVCYAASQEFAASQKGVMVPPSIIPVSSRGRRRWRLRSSGSCRRERSPTLFCCLSVAADCPAALRNMFQIWAGRRVSALSSHRALRA